MEEFLLEFGLEQFVKFNKALIKNLVTYEMISQILRNKEMRYFVYYLKDLKITFDKKNNKKNTPLLEACLEKNYEAMDFLIDCGSSVNETDDFGNTALHCLMLYKGRVSVSSVILLLENGADIEAENLLAMSPLMLAVREGQIEAVKVLLNEGANMLGAEGKTVLHHLSPRFNCFPDEIEELIEELLSRGAWSLVNVRDDDGYTPLGIVSRSGPHFNIFKILVKNGSYFTDNCIDPEWEHVYTNLAAEVWCIGTKYHEMAFWDLIEDDDLLLGDPKEISTRDANGWTPLHIASYWNNDHSTRKLLDANKVDRFEKTGDPGELTALHIACSRGHNDIVQLLLYHGLPQDYYAK